MKFLITVAACFFATLVCAQTVEQSLIGRWKVTAIMDFTPVFSFSDAQAKRLVGKYLTITPENIHFDKENCIKPKLTVTTKNTFEYFYSTEGYKMNPENLHLP